MPVIAYYTLKCNWRLRIINKKLLKDLLSLLTCCQCESGCENLSQTSFFTFFFFLLISPSLFSEKPNKDSGMYFSPKMTVDCFKSFMCSYILRK